MSAEPDAGKNLSSLISDIQKYVTITVEYILFTNDSRMSY